METKTTSTPVHQVPAGQESEVLKMMMRTRVSRSVAAIKEIAQKLQEAKTGTSFKDELSQERDKAIAEVHETLAQERTTIEARIGDLKRTIAELEGSLGEFQKMHDEEVDSITQRFAAKVAEHQIGATLTDAQQFDLRADLSRHQRALNLAEETLMIEEDTYQPVGQLFDESLLEEPPVTIHRASSELASHALGSRSDRPSTVPEAIEQVFHKSRKTWLGMEDLLAAVRETGVSVTLKTFNQTANRLVQTGRLVHDPDKKAYTLAVEAKGKAKAHA